MSKHINLIGMTFHNLTIINEVETPIHIKRKSRYYLCKCICDNTVIVQSCNLTSGHSKSCGCLATSKAKKKWNDIIGKKFGILTTINIGRKIKNYQLIMCKCDCGTIKEVYGSSLISGSIKSCGCNFIQNDVLETQKATAKIIYSNEYSDGNISFEQFYEKSQMNCIYCGKKAIYSNKYNVYLNKKSSRGYGVSNFALENGLFKYNGLDRIDNNLPHDFLNVVPCCKTCNSFKNDLSLIDFLSRINSLNKKITLPYIKSFIVNPNIPLSLQFPSKAGIKNKYNGLISKIHIIKKGAKKRNINFELNSFQCAEIITSNCIYCNIKPDIINGKYHGADRIDSKLGYTIDNCVPCCTYCNYGKNNLSLDDFLLWINNIKNHQNKTRSIKKLIKEIK